MTPRELDIAVFIVIVITLLLAVLTVFLAFDIQSFQENKYSGVTSSSIVIMDLVSPGEAELYSEYKNKFEYKVSILNACLFIIVISLAFTVGIAVQGYFEKSKRLPEAGSRGKDQE